MDLPVDCTILILTYKGKGHLSYLLPSIVDGIYRTKHHTFTTMVLDNGCDLSTETYIKRNFTGVSYIPSPSNDFLFSLNPIVAQLQSKYVFILNDDMKLHPDCLTRAMDVMVERADLFAVSCQELNWEGDHKVNGIRKLNLQRGFSRHYWVFEGIEFNANHYTLYPGGGSAIFNVSKFNALGGFDPIYKPGYSEDADLGIKAWFMGWPSLFCPGAVVYHREGGTFKKEYKSNAIAIVQAKHTLLWMFRNDDRPDFVFWYLILLPYRLIINFLRNRVYFWGMVKTIPHLWCRLINRDKPKDRVFTIDKIEMSINQQSV